MKIASSAPAQPKVAPRPCFWHLSRDAPEHARKNEGTAPVDRMSKRPFQPKRHQASAFGRNLRVPRMFCPCGPRAAQTGGPPRPLSALRCTRSKTLHSPYENRFSSARAAKSGAKTVPLAPVAGGAPPRDISHRSIRVKTRAQRPWIACRNDHSD